MTTKYTPSEATSGCQKIESGQSLAAIINEGDSDVLTHVSANLLQPVILSSVAFTPMQSTAISCTADVIRFILSDDAGQCFDLIDRLQAQSTPEHTVVIQLVGDNDRQLRYVLVGIIDRVQYPQGDPFISDTELREIDIDLTKIHPELIPAVSTLFRWLHRDSLDVLQYVITTIGEQRDNNDAMRVVISALNNRGGLTHVRTEG